MVGEKVKGRGRRGTCASTLTAIRKLFQLSEVADEREGCLDSILVLFLNL